MKKLLRKKEKGDIAIIAMFASILFVLILAIVVDFGLVYYQSAKLQNAVDATTVAVAHDLMSDDNAIQNTAEKYMRDNGIDLENTVRESPPQPTLKPLLPTVTIRQR